MDANELRALADALDDCYPPYYESSPTINRSLDACIAKAADYLRAQAAVCELKRELAIGKREPLTYEQMRAVLIAEARRIAEQAGEKDPDSLPVDEEMLAQVMLAGRAVERAHGIGGSDK